MKQPFPSEKRIDELSERSVAQPLAVVGTRAAVTSWAVDPAIPNPDWTKPYTGTDPNSAAFAAWLRTKAPKVTASASVTCLAQQYARFRAEHANAVAGNDTVAFMHARCGVPTPQVRVRYWSLDARKFGQLNPNKPISEVLAAVRGASHGALAGLGTWTRGNTIVVAVVAAQRTFDVAPISFSAGNKGSVVLHGVYPKRTEWMEAVVTHGPLGAKQCQRVPVSGPRGTFGFRCPTNPNDASAVIELGAAPRGALLGTTIARVWFSPNGSAPTRYDAPALRVPAPRGDFSSSAVLAGINTLRSQAGLPDVVGAPDQDQVAANLFPLLLAEEDPKIRDEAALGLMAGWQVDATVRGATFDTIISHADEPLARTLAGALFSPTFRRTALGRDTKVVATATLESRKSRTRGLLTAAYEIFEPRDFAQEETAVLDALDDARAKRGLPPVVRVQGGGDEEILAKSAERVRLGESSPQREMDRLLLHFSKTLDRTFYGSLHAPTRMEGWTPEFAEAFFEHEKLAVAVKVSYFTPPRGAWGQPVVFLMFTPL